MKSRLMKLTAVAVPALAAMALAPGSAAAWTLQPYCPSGQLSASSAYPSYDLNLDGYVCVGAKKNGAKTVVDNTYTIVW